MTCSCVMHMIKQVQIFLLALLLVIEKYFVAAGPTPEPNNPEFGRGRDRDRDRWTWCRCLIDDRDRGDDRGRREL